MKKEEDASLVGYLHDVDALVACACARSPISDVLGVCIVPSEFEDPRGVKCSEVLEYYFSAPRIYVNVGPSILVIIVGGKD